MLYDKRGLGRLGLDIIPKVFDNIHTIVRTAQCVWPICTFVPVYAFYLNLNKTNMFPAAEVVTVCMCGHALCIVYSIGWAQEATRLV